MHIYIHIYTHTYYIIYIYVKHGWRNIRDDLKSGAYLELSDFLSGNSDGELLRGTPTFDSWINIFPIKLATLGAPLFQAELNVVTNSSGILLGQKSAKHGYHVRYPMESHGRPRWLWWPSVISVASDPRWQRQNHMVIQPVNMGMSNSDAANPEGCNSNYSHLYLHGRKWERFLTKMASCWLLCP